MKRKQAIVGAMRFPGVRQLPVIAELPDPFLGPDGKRITTKQQWRRQRMELLRRVLHYEYGDLPPAPGNVIAGTRRTRHVKATGATEHKLRLKMGPGHAVATDLILTIPPGAGPFPAIIRGDLCWGRVKTSIAAAVVQRGYILAEFNRVQIADDSVQEDGVYLAYPGYDGGRIAAWAWGFHRVVDYLHTLDIVDRTRIAATGHSRGGKSALLAGATDERIALTAPNNSGCGGAGCYRLQALGSEDIASITSEFPYWFHARFRQFAGKVTRLPFDQHTVKALIAPRALLGTEALGDLWANPQGSQQSHTAAREVFAYLGAAACIGIRFRAGRHEHNAEDWAALLDFADWQFFGKNVFDRAAFPDAERGYSWRAPGRIGRMKGNGGR
ncbi:MAG: hypothetical protein IPM02_20810 [Betaproteobacteria bacterium]|nr:hypothetical protein [Betaproteobacteria bacterium]